MTALKAGFNKGVGKLMMQGRCTEADFDLIKKHNRYKAIDFWDCHLKNLDCILPLRKLETFCQYGGSVADYSALEHVPTLGELFLNSINQYGDLSFVRPLAQINRLNLLYLNRLIVFPDLSTHTALRYVRIWDCKRLTDLRALATIPNLREVHILGTPHAPADLEFLLQLDNLKVLNATFGTVRDNKRMNELLQHYGKLKHEL